MSKNVLLISVGAVKDRTAVHLNVDDKLIVPEIKSCQDLHIRDALGAQFFEHLQDGVLSDSLTDAEKILLDDYVTDTLVQYVLAALPMATSFQFFSKGVIRKTGDNTDLPGMGDMRELSEWYTKRAEFYRERLIRYIHANSSLFPGYAACGTGGEDSPADGGYSVPTYFPD